MVTLYSRKSKTAGTIAVAALLLSTSAFVKSAAASDLSSGDVAFMKMVGEGNIAEISVSKIAIKRASMGDTKNIAKMMIADHTKANMQLHHIAAMKSVTLPGAPNATHRALAAKLSHLSGASFDKLYVGSQLNDHTKTIAAFQHEAQTVKDADLKKFVLETLPAIQGHAQMLAAAQQKTASMAKM